MKARRVKGLDPDAPLADNASRIVTVRLGELRSFVPKALDPAKVEALHDMRIAAKRLRYVLELTAEPCFGAYAETGAKRARELQDLLGEIHDCDVTLPRVLALMDRGREPESLELVATHLRSRRALLFARFLDLWQSLERSGFAARLEYALRERPTSETSFSHLGNDEAVASETVQ